MMKLFSFFTLLFWSWNTYSQSQPTHIIFNAKGEKVTYAQLLNQASTADIVFFGELHNNNIAHQLQVQITSDLLKQQSLTLGFEMFEQDQQSILDSFVSQQMTANEFQQKMRLWSNYQTDYAPLVTIAQQHQFRAVATNIPRVFASMVFKKGRNSLTQLTEEERSWLCDTNYKIDYSLSQYQKMMKMAKDPQTGINFVNAQAIKDATMAKFILKHWTPNTQFIHFNGAFHTDFDQGIIWYIQQLQPNINYTTISTVEQKNLKKLKKEHINKAQFIICTPETPNKR